MNSFFVPSLSLWFKSDICWYLKWEDVPLGVGNSHCDTTGYSAAQWEPLDLDGVNTLTISAQISSAMMVAVVNTVTEAAAASLLSRPRLTPDSGLSPLRSISIPTPAALASPGWRQCTRGKKAGERRERGEIPPGNERGGGEEGGGGGEIVLNIAPSWRMVTCWVLPLQHQVYILRYLLREL